MDNQQQTLTLEQWGRWQQQEETQKFKAYIQTLIDDAKRQWANGEFTRPASLEHIATLNISVVEKIKTLQAVLEMDFEEYQGVMKEAHNAE